MGKKHWTLLCPVRLYRWETSGDVFIATINAGKEKSVSIAHCKKLRVIDTGANWSDLDYDKSYTVGADCNQTFNVTTDYCQTGGNTGGGACSHKLVHYQA